MKLLHRLLKWQDVVPTSITTDKLGSYRAALRDLNLVDGHVTGGRSNNGVENSYQPDLRRD